MDEIGGAPDPDVDLGAPQPISAEHRTDGFSCGNRDLDRWLRKRALANHLSGASRTFVVCQGNRVVAFYALATGGVARNEATEAVGDGMPDPVPVVLLGRFAVDRSLQGQGIGSDLLHDALMRILTVAGHVGVRAILVHAKDERAKSFYRRAGFKPSPVHPLMLMLSVAELQASLDL